MKFANSATCKTFCVGFLSLVITGFCLPSQAITVEEVPLPRPNGWVTDTIDILSPKTEAKINQLIDQLEAKNSSEIMVITVPETSPYNSPREFALAWFNHWKIGKKGLDNGVLLMYTKGEDRIEIVTGWGIIEILPDDQVVSLIKRKIRPRVNQKNFNGAMLTGTQEIIKVVQNYKPHPSPYNSNSITTEDTLNDFDFFNLLPIFLAIMFISSMFSKKSRSSKSSSSGNGDGGGGGSCGGGGGGDGGGGGSCGGGCGGGGGGDGG